MMKCLNCHRQPSFIAGNVCEPCVRGLVISLSPKENSAFSIKGIEDAKLAAIKKAQFILRQSRQGLSIEELRDLIQAKEVISQEVFRLREVKPNVLDNAKGCTEAQLSEILIKKQQDSDNDAALIHILSAIDGDIQKIIALNHKRITHRATFPLVGSSSKDLATQEGHAPSLDDELIFPIEDIHTPFEKKFNLAGFETAINEFGCNEKECQEVTEHLEKLIKEIKSWDRKPPKFTEVSALLTKLKELKTTFSSKVEDILEEIDDDKTINEINNIQELMEQNLAQLEAIIKKATANEYIKLQTAKTF